MSKHIKANSYMPLEWDRIRIDVCGQKSQFQWCIAKCEYRSGRIGLRELESGKGHWLRRLENSIQRVDRRVPGIPAIVLCYFNALLEKSCIPSLFISLHSAISDEQTVLFSIVAPNFRKPIYSCVINNLRMH